MIHIQLVLHTVLVCAGKLNNPLMSLSLTGELLVPRLAVRLYGDRLPHLFETTFGVATYIG